MAAAGEVHKSWEEEEEVAAADNEEEIGKN
jgi:hypothetical protein